MKPSLGDKIEILIVEDSQTQAEKLAFILQKNGFVSSLAANGREALASLEKQIPTMVISDIIMPEMDGFELSREIKSSQRLKHLPVLLLTTLSEPEDVLKGLESGADNFMNKPYEEQVLLSRINYILLNQELRRNRASSELSIEIIFRGKKQVITSDRIQILDLLLSSYETAILKNRELGEANTQIAEVNRALHAEIAERKRAEDALKQEQARLQQALDEVRTLRGIMPICAYCKKIRDDEGYWNQVEQYVSKHTEAKFSHGICPSCFEREMKGIETSS